MKKSVPHIQFKRKRLAGSRPDHQSAVLATPAVASTAPDAPAPTAVQKRSRLKRPMVKPAPRVGNPKEGELPDLQERLAENFPEAFGSIKPLKVGIHKDIWLRLPDVDHSQLDALLSRYTRQPEYLQALANGGSRVGLDGEEVEAVSDFARNLSTKRLSSSSRKRATS